MTARVSQRDQEVSSFSRILERLCGAAGALAAAFVDSEGETVDYAGRLDPYDIRIAAAEWRLALDCIVQAPVFDWSELKQFIVRAQLRSYAITTLGDGYALVIALPRHAFKVSHRAVAEAVRELSVEADLGWAHPADARERWVWASVRTTPETRLRPLAVWRNETWSGVTILGRYSSDALARGESGYRARLSDGEEVTLVREPLGRWFINDV